MEQYVDISSQLYTPKSRAQGAFHFDERARRTARFTPDREQGVSVEDYIQKMDRAGILHTLIIALRAGTHNNSGSFEVPYQDVHEACRRFPDRLSGLAGIDPSRGMEGLRDMERGIRDYGFVGAHVLPHWFSKAPDAAIYYPYYAKCCELDVPILIHVGQNLVYDRSQAKPSVGRPICLDQIAIDFPDLRIIGSQQGYPWTSEMISMSWKHENVYIGANAYSPKHWSPEFVHYANSYGSHKVLFGSEWPIIDPERAVAEVVSLGLRPDSLGNLMSLNALKVFPRIATALKIRESSSLVS